LGSTLAAELYQTVAYEQAVGDGPETELRRLTVTLNHRLQGLLDAAKAHFPSLRGLNCDLSKASAWGATVKIHRLHGQLSRKLAEVANAGQEQDQGAVCKAAPAATGGYTFRRRRDYWEIGEGENTELVKDSLGVRYIAILLSRPGKQLHVRD